MASRAHGPCTKNPARRRARRISPTSFGGWWPEPGGGAWPRTRCRRQSPVPDGEVVGIGDESTETMIPPASRSKGELVHMARSIRNHFARSLIVAREQKIAGDLGDEAGGADDRPGGEIDDAQAIRPCTSCLDVMTLRSAAAMLNCTEVSGRHRNGWLGYTKVYEPGFAQRNWDARERTVGQNRRPFTERTYSDGEAESASAISMPARRQIRRPV
jgi:hypothetical protein